MEENKKFIITIVILVFIILGLGGFIYYDKFYKTEKEEKTITTIDNVDIDLNSFYLVGDTLEKFDKAFNDKNSTYFGYIYKDRDANHICKDYRKMYEEMVNVYINDIKSFNKIIDKYNEDTNNNLEKYKSNLYSDYIDFDKDGVYNGK